MAILGFVEWFGVGLAAALAGCAALGLAGRASEAPALRPVRVRARRR